MRSAAHCSTALAGKQARILRPVREIFLFSYDPPMPMLRVPCKRCKVMIPTGMEMSHEAFRNATFITNTVDCPACKSRQNWTLDDVDRSVFKTPGK